MDIGKSIRNFSIIAHIDHGKSTLADRLLEITGTVEKRKMKAQVLDSMELEKERGITIKMTPVRMNYGEYVLNLIDTPGHIDFYYEVSRALKAVEGSLLLVDATQGVQAQTLSTLNMAREQGLVIIPVISKIDSPLARIDDVKLEIMKLLNCEMDDIVLTSGKTGEGVENLLQRIITKIPPPKHQFDDSFRGLVFDFQYSNHRGVIVYMRVADGSVKKGDTLLLKATESTFTALEVGIFAPEEKTVDELHAGEIGYVVTGIKEPGIATVGDTVTGAKKPLPSLAGYLQPRPVVWASIYTESQDDFNMLRQALERLSLSDSSFSFEEESSGLLGRGFRCGFLGMLHLEIITERLKREFKLVLVVTTPSITYEVSDRRGKTAIYYSPNKFPEYGDILKIREPWVNVVIITPSDYLGILMPLLYDHEAEVGESETFGDNRASVKVYMPLRELMRNFFDEVKSATSGYASLNYSIGEMRDADVVKMEVFVADELVPAFTKIVSTRRMEEDAHKTVEKLYEILPRQMFVTKIQAKAAGRIISSKTLSAMRKDVTGYLYGGDITRKMKLLEKQKKGKKRMLERGKGKVDIPQDVFLKMMKDQ